MSWTSSFTNQRFARIASTTALLVYPIGGIASIYLPKHLEGVGGFLLALSCFAFVCALPSYVIRVALQPRTLAGVDPEFALDQLEIDLRRRAQAFSFQVFSVLILAGILYMTVAADFAGTGDAKLWMPRVDDHWLAILFGALLYVVNLPVVYLAWMMPAPLVDDQNGEDLDAEEADCKSAGADTVIMTSMFCGCAASLLLPGDMLLWASIGVIIGGGFSLMRYLKK